MKFITALLLLLTTCYCASAQTSTENAPDTGSHFHLNYDLAKPDFTAVLDDDLEEISGLSLSADGQKLLAIQDEDGMVFELDKATGLVTDDYTFHKEGDYEGVEMVGESVFVVKSNGKIYEIHQAGEDRQQTIKYTTALNKEYDVEGLGYDPVRKCLLLACKELGDAEGDGKTDEK